MDSFTLSTTSKANSFSAIQFFSQRIFYVRKSRILTFPCRKLRKHLVFASKDEPRLDEWDKMELKFGRMIGEDPKMTLAKIIGRKSNPDMSYLEIEKLFNKKKGRASIGDREEIPFDMSDKKKSTQSTQGLNLVRPVPKKGHKFEETNKPVGSDAESKSSIRPIVDDRTQRKSSVPDVILRKPSSFYEDNGGNGKSSVLGMKPNLSLKMGIEPQKERFSDITLLKKPEPITSTTELGEEKSHSDSNDGKARFSNEIIDNSLILQNPEMRKPEPMTITTELGEEKSHSDSNNGKAQFSNKIIDNSLILQKPEVRKPEPITSTTKLGEEKSQSDSNDGKARFTNEIIDNSLILQKPEVRKLNFNEGDKDSSKEQMELISRDLITESNTDVSNLDDGNIYQFQETEQKESAFDKGSIIELQGDMLSGEETLTSDVPSRSNPAISIDSVLKGKPTRLDPSGKTTNQKIRDDVIPVNPESSGNPSEPDNFLTTFPIKEGEDGHWDRAEELVKTREREEVELISASTRGFVVLFGSLIGFLPYRNLAARWKFLAFESWLRRKGLDPSDYRQNLGIIGRYEASSMMDVSESLTDSDFGSKSTSAAVTSDMKLEDVLMIYDQEKLKFLSSFVGQRVRVGVVLADRTSRKLIVSIKPKEKEELVEKKRSLMARLSVGDVIKCCITKITYFGVFVEVEGVPALIHQSEVSWDATLDPASYFKVGQLVDAKVHQLDFSMDRIFLSLKEITPDPLIETLDAVVGDHDSLDGRLEAAEADSEWADVESIVKDLEQFDGIQSVSKGRYFLSPGLAPTFQVYMASMFENQYKLLARAGNRVQELIVQTTLSKEELKSAILTCTNRVE